MSYRIEYHHGAGKYEIREERKVIPGILTTFALFLALTFAFWPEGAAALRDMLIPGNDAVTVQAFQTLAQNLKSGTPIPDAVESFCQFVIHES